MLNIILFLLALFPVVFLGYYIYSKDSLKEPKKILIKLFIGGLCATIITICFSLLFNFIPYLKNDIKTYNTYQLLFYCFIVVAMVEELSKFIMTYKIAYHNKEFDQLYDMIVYAVFVSLGFAWIENILYVFDGGVKIAIYRLFLAVPTHAIAAVFMGYYLSLAKLSDIKNDNKNRRKNLILSIIVPIILHGSYDYLVYSSNRVVVFTYFIFILAVANTKIKEMSDIKGTFLMNYCPNCGQNVGIQNYCKNCGEKLTKDSL